MQRRSDLVRELEDRFVVEHPLAYPDALRLYEAMWQEACDLGILPGDPWDGVEDDIRLARILKSMPTA